MVLKTKELKIKDESGKVFEITIQQINWIKSNQITDEVTSLDQFGKPQIKVGAYRIKQLMASIIKAPFNYDEKGLSDIDPRILDQIYTEVVEINSLTDKKKIPSGE